MPERDETLLLDMLIAARKAARFAWSTDLAAFLADEVIQSALAYQLQTIGEAAARVSASSRVSHPQIPWRQVVGLRNRIVHDYTRLDLRLIWAIVSRTCRH